MIHPLLPLTLYDGTHGRGRRGRERRIVATVVIMAAVVVIIVAVVVAAAVAGGSEGMLDKKLSSGRKEIALTLTFTIVLIYP